jgi:hypothetical protein
MPLILIATREHDGAQRYCVQARSADTLSTSHDPATAPVSRSAVAMPPAPCPELPQGMTARSRTCPLQRR